MAELVAGKELDRAVCYAIGMGEQFDEAERIGENRFAPSDNLNSAFAAAEKALRVDRCGHMNLSCGFSDREPYFECEMSWAEGNDEQGWKHPEVIGTGPTPAFAICVAILKLKGYDFMHGRLDVVGDLQGNRE